MPDCWTHLAGMVGAVSNMPTEFAGGAPRPVGLYPMLLAAIAEPGLCLQYRPLLLPPL
jgi:hypothetical protein